MLLALIFSVVALAGDVKYPLPDRDAKLVDNRGRGYEALAGTRNFRYVLSGKYYRGGKINSHGNANPMTEAGLYNLCEEGFSDAVYLYSTNFRPKLVECSKGTLRYHQISPLAYRRSDQLRLLTMMRDAPGSVYMHCWNGWHASGFVAAIALRQFCGYSADAAVAYWNKNTDGANGPGYEKVRQQIRKFVPFEGLTMSKEFCQ